MQSIGWRLERKRRSLLLKLMLIVFALVIGLNFYVNATIAMESCSGIDTTPTEKLVISRFIANGPQDSAQNWDESYPFWAASALTVNLTAALNVRFAPINCHRYPNVDGSDFRLETVSEMRDRHVLFEVWGNLATHLMNKRTAAEATVIYFMVPAPESPWLMPAPISWNYQDQNVVLRKLFKGIFTLGHHFEVLAAVAYGIEESRNREYDKAQAALCKAKVMVRQNSQSRVWRDLHLEKLTDAIEDLAKRNLKYARSDPAYDTALKNLPEIQATAGNICPIE